MGSFCALRKRKRNPRETTPKNGPKRPKSTYVDFLKAKKKADKEKAGWGIAFSEFIARAGVGLDGAEEMDAATMQL